MAASGHGTQPLCGPLASGPYNGKTTAGHGLPWPYGDDHGRTCRPCHPVGDHGHASVDHATQPIMVWLYQTMAPGPVNGAERRGTLLR